MSIARKRDIESRRTSVQVFRYSRNFAIRLEFDRIDERQCVFVNNELRSAFHCPAGFHVEHVFRGTDPMSEESFGEWKIKFAVEEPTFRIRYEMSRRNAGGSDTKWYWYDRNVEPDAWQKFPEFEDREPIAPEPDAHDNDQPLVCTCPVHGLEMHCAECDFECGLCITCGKDCLDCSCDDEAWLAAFDSFRRARVA